MMTLSVSAASSTQYIESHTYLTVAPNPIGVNQQVSVIFWLDNSPPQVDSTRYYGWNFTVVITQPDGTTITQGPYQSDSVGGSYCIFTPTTTGTYKFQAFFTEATVNVTTRSSLPIGLYVFKQSQSRMVELTVQQDQIQGRNETALPTGYWSFPISAENRDWYSIAGDWLSGSPAYRTTAPESAHILWTKQLTFGGITGDFDWGINYYSGLLYENKFSPKIISGKLFYNMFTGPSMFASNIPSGVICVDLATGEEVWRNASMPQITAAQVLLFNSGMQSGTTAYLWTTTGTTWQMYDAFTGRLLTSFVNASGSLSSNYGPNGEMMIYSVSGATNRLILWNSTKAVIPVSPRETSATYKPWTTAIRSWSDGIQLNVTVPDVPGSQSAQLTDMTEGVIVAQATITGYGLTPTFVHVGYDAFTGQQLWVKNWTDVGWGAGGPTSPGLLTFTAAKGEGYYAFFQKETMQWHVVNIHTGQEAWATHSLSEYTNSDWSVYDWSGQIAYGKLIVDGYSGDVVAFDLTTGQHLWTFTQGSSGLDTPYGTWPSFGGVTVADNKVYFGVTEHTPNTPMMRGYQIYCIDVETGDLLWNEDGFFSSIAISAGKMVGYAAYDNQIYCYGKGLSQTTVDAPMSGVTVGSPIAIRGTVTDQSPGQTAIGVPAAGTPAISDDNMTAWMAYLYMQQTMPTNVKGVPVNIYISDKDGNIVYNTQTTSDASGTYIISWTPQTEGTLIVNAVFDGSNSYYSSTGTTGLVVGTAAAQPTQTEPTTTTEPTNTATATTTPSASPSTAIENPSSSSIETILIAVAAAVITIAVISAAIILHKRK